MQNLLFGITLEKRIYLHIQNLVILHSIASEYSFTFKSTLFKNPTRGSKEKQMIRKCYLLFSFCPAKNPLIYLKSTHRLALESNYICTFAYYF